MNDWNYTKKVGKIFFIYAITFWLSIKVAQFITGPWIHTTYNDFGGVSIMLITLLSPLIIPGLVLLAPIHLLFPSLFTFFDDDLLLILCSGVISWIFIGFLMDLYIWNLNKKNPEGEIKKSQREKGVFIRIPFGSREIVISEKIVNCIIIAEIILLVIFIGIIFSGVMHDNSGVEYENEIDGKYVKGGYTSGIAIYFNKSTSTFSECYPYGKIENGTYIINKTLLKIYYSNGTTKEYIIKNVNQLSPANRSQFSSEDEWYENWYAKPWRM